MEQLNTVEPASGSTVFTVKSNGATAENAAWYYPFPNYQYAPIQDLVAFYPERVDQLLVDGEPAE